MIDRLFTRDNLTWTLTLIASMLTLATTTLTSWIPPAYAPRIGELAGFLGALSGLLRTSPLPHSRDL